MELFVGFKGVDDVYAAMEQSVLELFAGVKGVVTCLLGVGAGCCGALRWRQRRRDVLDGFWSWVLVPGEEVIFLPTHTVCIVEYPQVQFLARLLTCPLFLRQVRMVPDVQKTFGGCFGDLWRCVWRWDG